MQQTNESLVKSNAAKNINVQFERQKHPFHILRPSKYPFFVSVFVFMWLVPQVLYMHGIDLPFGLRPDVLHFGFVGLFGVAMSWFFRILKESAEGYHTKKVQLGLRTGMLLFILSEVMFFFAFFWGFFHYTLIPSAAIGAIWPPLGTQPLDVWGLPLVNTMLLLTSGVTITVAHSFLINDHYVIAPKWAGVIKYRSIKEMIDAGIDMKRALREGVICKSRNHDGFQWYLFLTVVLGVAFLLCQAYEYKHGVKFSWRENIYGSIFFVTTGFHGLHVTIGTLFLAYNLVRSYAANIVAEGGLSGLATQERAWLSHMSFERNHHFGFEAAAWYWHFVDVVWLFLFVTVYWWGGR